MARVNRYAARRVEFSDSSGVRCAAFARAAPRRCRKTVAEHI